MKLPRVSLVMPTMNSAEFIAETLLSLAAQPYANLELVVVDGGSSDATLDIVDRFNDGSIRVIELAPGLGIARALNEGIAAASGEFIGRMDADDLMLNWRLADQVGFLMANPQVDLLGSGADAFGDHEGAFRNPRTHADIFNAFLSGNPYIHPTVMFRRAIAESGLYRYDETFLFEEDYELWGRLIPRIVCANLDWSTIRYRIRGSSAQWDARKYRFKRQALLGFCQSVGLDDDDVIDALTEFQCGSFIRKEHHEALREYALSVEGTDLPRVGWLHEALIRERGYANFTSWFRSAKGWPA